MASDPTLQEIRERLDALQHDPMEDGMTDEDFAAIGQAAREARGRPLTRAEMGAMLDEIEQGER